MEQHGTTIISFSQPGGSTHLLPLLLLENLGPLSLGSSELFCFSREWKRWLGCNKSAKMVSKSLYGYPSSEAPTTSSCALCKAWQATQMQTICHFAVPLGRINHRNHENEAPTHRETPLYFKSHTAPSTLAFVVLSLAVAPAKTCSSCSSVTSISSILQDQARRAIAQQYK